MSLILLWLVMGRTGFPSPANSFVCPTFPQRWHIAFWNRHLATVYPSFPHRYHDRSPFCVHCGGATLWISFCDKAVVCRELCNSRTFLAWNYLKTLQNSEGKERWCQYQWACVSAFERGNVTAVIFVQNISAKKAFVSWITNENGATGELNYRPLELCHWATCD